MVHPYAAYVNSPAHQWADSLRNYVWRLEGISVQPLMFGPGYFIGSACFLHILRPGLDSLTIHLWLPEWDQRACLKELGDSARYLESAGYTAVSISSEQDLNTDFPLDCQSLFLLMEKRKKSHLTTRRRNAHRNH